MNTILYGFGLPVYSWISFILSGNGGQTLLTKSFHSIYPSQFVNPRPTPKPPTERPPHLRAFPSTHNVPGNMSQLSLSPSIRSTTTYNDPGTPLSRATTLSDGYGSGGVIVLKEGYAKVKDGLLWKTRYLMLRGHVLDLLKTPDGKVGSTIQLKDVTSVTRSETTALTFEISRVANPAANTGGPGSPNPRDLPQKLVLCQLKTDDEIYEWIDAIYNRCPGMGGVSNPTNFSHRVHVGFDPVNGSFVGLPPEWERLLNASAITKEDLVKHPEAVIEVLEFYSDITKRSEMPQEYPSLTPTPPVITKQNMQLGHGGAGTSVAAPRPQQPNGQYQQRSMMDQPSRSHTGTPVSQRNVSGGGGALDHNQQKMNMNLDMRRVMEAEAQKVKEKQAREQRERDRAREEEEHNRKEQEAYNAAIPKARSPMSKQEVGGYGGNDAGMTARYNPSRNAPPAPGTDRSRTPQQGSLRNQPAQRQVPQASNGVNGTPSVPKATYATSSPHSRDESPSNAQRSLRAQKPDHQRQPSPKARSGSNPNDRNHAPQSTRPNGAQAKVQQPASARGPGTTQNVAPLNIGTKQPTGAPATNGAHTDPHKQAELALTAKPAPRQKEVRMSSMTESQVMEKLKQVVSKDDPQLSYTKQRKIGQGASGSVYVARINEGAVSPVAKRIYRNYGGRANVAIKQMDLRNQPRKELIVNEIIVMKESSHPNIVNFLDSFLQEGNNELWVVMEFMEGGALTDVIDNNPSISEAQISTICNEVSPPIVTIVMFSDPFWQTCKGLAHLHSQNIIHRDIKSDNVLLDARGNVKIS